MRLDRLLSIVMLLVNRKRVQAGELARIFEVSVRTIYRDIEAINQAGIPVITYQGVNGGLGISDNYKVDRNVLSQDDIVSIIRALNGLKTTLDDHKLSGTIEKIKGLIPDCKTDAYREKSNRIIIDLTPWGGNEAQKDKINLLKCAIDKCIVVSFRYSDAKGEATRRKVEPVCLVLKTNTWYLYGYCRLRQDFRLFKLSRMKELAETDLISIKRESGIEDSPWETQWGNNCTVTEVVLRFVPKLKTLVEERFEPEKISEDDSGYVTVRIKCPEDEWLYGMILSYADDVEVLEPGTVREVIRGKIKMMQKIYNDDFKHDI